MTGTTISSYATTGLVLTQASQNPVTITAAGTINTLGAYAIYGSSSTAWAITNSGSLSGGSNGVRLVSGGSVTNGSATDTTALISGGGLYGVFIAGAGGIVTNYGTISGGGSGISLQYGGSVTNGSATDTTALISGGGNGVGFKTTAGTVANYGTISGTGTYSDGVRLEAGGSVTNGSATDTTALISGGGNGVEVEVFRAAGTVANYGTISGGSSGIFLRYGGRVSNGSANDTNASISGNNGVDVGFGVSYVGTVANYGTISGGGTNGIGVRLFSGGSVTNGSTTDTTASISGYYGVAISGAGTVANYGTMSGVFLGSGGVTNGSATTDTTALIGGVTIVGAGTVANYGTISGYSGVFIRGAGSVANYGTISGRYSGVYIIGAGSVANAGRIIGTSFDGVSLNAGGVVTNAAGGVIVGATGVGATGVAATIVNSGSISGSAGNGIYLAAGGLVTNAGGARISGTKNGVSLKGGGSVANAGTITATVGVFLAAAGDVTNYGHGLISGSADGVLVNASNVTVTNAATISGANYSVQFKGFGTDTLIVDPSAVFLGIVNGASATSTLVLASAASAGKISGLGTEFAEFQAVTEAVGANWIVAGTNSLATTTALTVNGALTDAGSFVTAGAATVKGTLATRGTGTVQLGHGLTLQSRSVLLTASTGSIEIGTAGGVAKGVVTIDKGSVLSGAGTIKTSVVDMGGIQASGGRLSVAGSLIGTGAVSISSHSVLAVGGKMAAAGLNFLSGGQETAVFSTPTAVGSTLAGFAASDTIDLVGFVKATARFVGHTLTIHSTSGSVAHLNFAASYVTKDFAFATDHHGGTNITFV